MDVFEVVVIVVAGIIWIGNRWSYSIKSIIDFEDSCIPLHERITSQIDRQIYIANSLNSSQVVSNAGRKRSRGIADSIIFIERLVVVDDVLVAARWTSYQSQIVS